MITCPSSTRICSIWAMKRSENWTHGWRSWQTGKSRIREGVLYYLRDGRVRGVLLWNVWEQVDAARRLIAEPGPFRADDLIGRLPA